MKKLQILSFLFAAFSLTAFAQNVYVADPDQHLLEGEWTLYTIYGQKVTGEDRPYIEFELSHMRFYGSNGCNVLNGSISLSKNNRMQLTDIIATRMHCDNAPFEFLINTSLEKVCSYKITHNEHEFFLDLFNEQHQEIMTFHRHNMDFLNGIWTVTMIDGIPNDNPDVQLAIDIQGGKLHGNTDCNIINGHLSLDPDKTRAIQFNNITSTNRPCNDNQRESTLLIALEEVVNALAEGPDRVVMTNSRGRHILTLLRTR